MKNFINTFAIAVAIFASATVAVHAEDKETKKSSFATGIYVNKAGKVNVVVEKSGAATPTTLLLRNGKGEVLYSENVGKKITKFGKQLNLDDLTPGQYQVEVISNGVKETKTLQLSENVEREISIK